jgi:hypothetical protein
VITACTPGGQSRGGLDPADPGVGNGLRSTAAVQGAGVIRSAM